MKITVRLGLLLSLLPFLLPSQTIYDPLLGKLRTNPTSSGGGGISACGATPPAAGAANSTCYDTSGNIWQCSNGASACTTAAQWVTAGCSYSSATNTTTCQGNVKVGTTNPIVIGGATGSCAGAYAKADGTGCGTPSGSGSGIVVCSGMAGDGTTDDSSALQACITGLKNYQELLIPTPTNFYKINSTINIHSFTGIRMASVIGGSGSLNQQAGQPSFMWGGADGGTMFSIQDCTGCTFGPFLAYTGTGNGTGTTGADVLLDVDQSATPTYIMTNSHFYVGLYGTQRRTTVDLLRFSAVSANNVEKMFVDPGSVIQCSDSGKVGIGINNNHSSNALFHSYSGISVSYCATGINVIVGSATIDGVQFEADLLDVAIAGAYSDEVANSNSEGSTQFVTVSGPGKVIRGNRVDSVNPPASHGAIDTAGTDHVTVENNTFGNSSANADIYCTSDGSVLAIGNNFTSANKAATLSGLSGCTFGAFLIYNYNIGLGPFAILGGNNIAGQSSSLAPISGVAQFGVDIYGKMTASQGTAAFVPFVPFVQNADPGCTISTQLGKVWFNTTTTTTTYQTCRDVSGTIGWVTSGSGTFTALTGDATSTATGGATTVQKVNGNTPGGTCSTGQMVTSVDSSGRPTCSGPVLSVTVLPAASAALVQTVYYMTAATTANICPTAGDSAGSASAYCVSNGTTYTALIAAPGATGNVALPGTLTVGTTVLSGTTATDSASLGVELTDATGWTSTGWTGSYNAFTHTAGNTTALSRAIAGIANGKFYQVVLTISSRTAGSVSVSIGSTVMDDPTLLFSTSATYTYGPMATGTGALTITPTTDFNGIVAVSVKLITAIPYFVLSMQDSMSATSIALLNQLASLQNIYLGGGGSYNTTGADNACVGFYCLYQLTTGSSDVALGRYALFANTSGSNNAALGELAMRYNTTGSSNACVGYECLLQNTVGVNNACVGDECLKANTTGYYNSGFGNNALFSNTVGYYNTAVGGDAMRAATTGFSNTGLGTDALYMLTTGDYNTGLGQGALFTTNGNNNTAVGYNAGRTNSTGSGNIFIGYSAGYNENGSNKLYIDNTNTATPCIGGDLSARTLAFGCSMVPVPTPNTSITLTGASGVAICTGNCTVTVPVPAAGFQFCAWVDDNVSATITFAALGSSAMYENSARTAYGAAGTGTLSAVAAVGNKACIFGRDSTHYQTFGTIGTWSVN